MDRVDLVGGLQFLEDVTRSVTRSVVNGDHGGVEPIPLARLENLRDEPLQYRCLIVNRQHYPKADWGIRLNHACGSFGSG